MRYRDVHDPEDERAQAAARSLKPTPGLEGLAQALGLKPEKAPVGPLSSEQPLPGKKAARGRRAPVTKSKPAKKRGRRG